MGIRGILQLHQESYNFRKFNIKCRIFRRLIIDIVEDSEIVLYTGLCVTVPSVTARHPRKVDELSVETGTQSRFYTEHSDAESTPTLVAVTL